MDALFESRKTTELIWGNVRMCSSMAHYCHVCGGYYNDHDGESLSILNRIKGELFGLEMKVYLFNATIFAIGCILNKIFFLKRFLST